MLHAVTRICLVAWSIVALAVATDSARASPPASCAHKFIGTWVYPGGTTVIAAGGTAYPKCPLCVPTQSWTCQGNTYLFSNSGPPGQFSATLSADGRQLIGGGIVATRVGGAAPVPATAVKPTQPAPPIQATVAAPKPPIPSKSASCSSDITGTSSKTQTVNQTAAVKDCNEAKRHLHNARVTRQRYPLLSEDEFKKAAAAAHRAGDKEFELAIFREAASAPNPTPTDSETCAKLMQEARPYITAAEAIEKEDPSCEGLTAAADHYYTVGKLFFRAIELGQTRDQLLSSCPNLKTNEFLLRRDRLTYRVDDMKAKGLCELRKPQPVVNKGGGKTETLDNDEERRKKCQWSRQRLAPHAPSPEWLANEMARGHCRPDGEPMSSSEIAQWESQKKQ